jgi:rhamnogalacturonan endolyase
MIVRILLLGTILLLAAPAAHAQRQMERLGRGVIAVRTNSAKVYIGWRLLGSDPDDLGFNLYRVAGGATNKLNSSLPLTNTTDFIDSPSSFAVTNLYFVRPVSNGVELAPSAAFALTTNAPIRSYFTIPIQPPPDGTNYSYTANDASVADLDGDGEYELVLKWDPSNSKDNSLSGYTGDVFLDAYRLDGTRLWRIDLGKNIRAGAHYTQFMVYDLDGDGKAEVACKTAPGTIDGQGNYVLMPGDSATSDYRNSSGYILSGPEYLTIFNGQTGAAIATTNYNPPRGSVSSWGDSYGNRVDRFLACVAYLDGARPSLVMCRGYYTRAVLAAWNWRNGQLTNLWNFDTTNAAYAAYAGQGNHSLSVSDVDHDGKDEILYGACSIDHDGKGLYSTGLGHGDAEHISDLDPDRPGIEVWDVHETPSSYSAGEYRDAKTGQLIWGVAATDDTGRGMAAHIDSGHRGFQMWSSYTSGVYDVQGNLISSNKPSVNFAIWWDADVDRELLDGVKLDKWTGNGTSRLVTFSSYEGAVANNTTKANPSLSADILGDWREEVILPNSNSTALVVFTTTIGATNRFPTFMHDPQYRLSVALQNVAYNQPPHTSFYVGEDMYPVPLAPVSDAHLVWRGDASSVWDASALNWRSNNVWISNTTALAFPSGDTVLFDSSGSNSAPIQLSGTLAPAKVTVYSFSNYVFAGSGSIGGNAALSKAGAGALTLSNTNSYSGPTSVRDGVLWVNGALPQSAVTACGNAWGGAVVGGLGTLGQGLLLQKGANLSPGFGTNQAGALTISNSLGELGNVANEFHLSNDPGGSTKTNDLVTIAGNLTLKGSNTVSIVCLNGSLASGAYPLFNYSGTLTGGLTNLTLLGINSNLAILTNPPGQIALLVSSNLPLNLTWAGGGSNTWTIGGASNWFDGSALAAFHTLDSVRFEDAGATNTLVTLVSNVSPGSVLADASSDYTLAGTGGISGTCGLTKTNTGTLTLAATNSYTGPTVIGQGIVSASYLIGGGTNSALGASGSGATNLVFCGGTLRYTGPSLTWVRCATLTSAGGTIDIPGSSTALGLAGGYSSGPGALTKTGAGTLALTVDNNFSGGVNVNAGTLQLGSLAAAGAGPIILNGGTLALNAAGDPAYYANPVSIATDSSLTSPGSGNKNHCFNGALFGPGNLTLTTSSGGTFSVAATLEGFSGTLTLGGAGTFRFYDSPGSSQATFDLGTNGATILTRAGGTVNLGALAGGPGSFLKGGASSAVATTYIVGSNGLSTLFAGTITNGTKGAAATTALVKVGSGTLSLTGTNTYSGGTLLCGGTVLVNNPGGSGLGTGSIIVSNGATLGGSGYITGATSILDGILAPGGALPGTLTFSSGLSLANASTANFACGATSDLISVTGNLTLGGTLNLSAATGFAAGAYTLFTYSGNLTLGSVTLGAMPAGYVGALDTSSAGLVRVKVTALPRPAFARTFTSGTNLVLNATNGTAGQPCSVLTSTNLSLPIANWSLLCTNQFPAGGTLWLTNPIPPNTPAQFFLIRIP